jgi:hypothetical protein
VFGSAIENGRRYRLEPEQPKPLDVYVILAVSEHRAVCRDDAARGMGRPGKGEGPSSHVQPGSGAAATDSRKAERHGACDAFHGTSHCPKRHPGAAHSRRCHQQSDETGDDPVLCRNTWRSRLVVGRNEDPDAQSKTDGDPDRNVAQRAPPLRRPETASTVRLEVAFRDAKGAQQRFLLIHHRILPCHIPDARWQMVSDPMAHDRLARPVPYHDSRSEHRFTAQFWQNEAANPPSQAPSETENASGSSSVVEHYLAKVGVASSSLVSR